MQGLKDLQYSRNSGEKDSDGFAVRYFEQDGDKRTELPNDEAFGESVAKLDGTELKEALRDIQASLGSKEERDAFSSVLREVGGDMNRVESAADLEKMMERIESYTGSIDAEIESAGSNLPQDLLDELRKDLRSLSLVDDDVRPGTGLPQISDRTWTPNQRKKIKRLNAALAQAFRESRRKTAFTKNTVSSVFRAYHAARITLARAWGSVPVDVWDLLWTVLSADESINLHRLSHISLLSRDMSDARVTLSPPQQLLTVEAVFVDGWESKAIDSWKRCVSTLGDEKSATFQDYWELGVRMFCRTGDLHQAERAAAKLLAKGLDPRIMMPLIRTYSERATPESQAQAWTSYRKMRDFLGKEMGLSDYDQVISYFLTTNQTENALHAFVDMMSNGQIDLKKQKYMPSVVANKFFLGKWLKRLIGAGDLDGAFRVVEFMRQRGVEASPIHLNGLIGAWQRSGGARDLELADKLGWDMIESRIKFVQRRGDTKLPPDDTASTATSSPWPRATLETFSLMAENYRLRDLHARLEALWRAFHDAEISPDAFMMNQLLESHIQAYQPDAALSLYHSLVTERGMAPDPYTFSALWKTLAVNRLHVVSREDLPQEIGRTRALFAETTRFATVFEPDGGMDGQLARKVLHTFRRLRDSAGLVVALAALKHRFRFALPDMLAMELLLDTTKLSWDSPAHRTRLMLAKRALDQGLLAHVDATTTAADTLSSEQRQAALHEYVQSRFWPADVQAVKEAAQQMGVHELLATSLPVE